MDRPRDIRKLVLAALVTNRGPAVLWPWLLEDKIITMTTVGKAMACRIAVLAVVAAVQPVSRRATISLSYLGMVAAPPGPVAAFTRLAFRPDYTVGRGVGVPAAPTVSVHCYRLTCV
ncbi:hypothetical protein KZC45_22955 [Salmonella enterica subsp. enterica serovar Javiana]|uniref:hypothetical protein n=1 Tax=Salmonella enterica TaxID=28901 RepID=UPI001C5B89A2|nr:hypothetical protein [Salmonella enterica]MBW3174088.1 hypothetical protein [Salmonella enterica subsp. enterica serovar Javiana]